mmetsp:Transcript_37478/g.61608  ORF Transcript_37478/g.61608 Transcript_37478/m.61608 type:complete len:218 (-) Transcript_37478:684-1337(-)
MDFNFALHRGNLLTVRLHTLPENASVVKNHLDFAQGLDSHFDRLQRFVQIIFRVRHAFQLLHCLCQGCVRHHHRLVKLVLFLQQHIHGAFFLLIVIATTTHAHSQPSTGNHSADHDFRYLQGEFFVVCFFFPLFSIPQILLSLLHLFFHCFRLAFQFYALRFCLGHHCLHIFPLGLRHLFVGHGHLQCAFRQIHQNLNAVRQFASLHGHQTCLFRAL